MGFLDSAAVKKLKEEAEEIGGLVAMQAFGEIPQGAADEVVQSQSRREALATAFAAAAAEIGSDKALKKAVKEAQDQAGSMAYVRHIDTDRPRELAGNAIHQMLTSRQSV
jgi:hypothetical protein